MPTPSETFEAAHRLPPDDIEPLEKVYKPSSRDCQRNRRCDQGDELAGDLVDHYKLWVLPTAGWGHSSGRRDSNQNRYKGE